MTSIQLKMCSSFFLWRLVHVLSAQCLTRLFCLQLHTTLARPHDLTCQVCEKQCFNDEKFYRHMHKCHPDYWRVFAGGRPLSDFIHEREVKHRDKPYMCQICHKRYSHETGLIKHMASHPDYKPDMDLKMTLYSCTVCEKLFTRESYLERHMEMKTDDGHVAALDELRQKRKTQPAYEISLGARLNHEAGARRDLPEALAKPPEAADADIDITSHSPGASGLMSPRMLYRSCSPSSYNRAHPGVPYTQSVKSESPISITGSPPQQSPSHYTLPTCPLPPSSSLLPPPPPPPPIISSTHQQSDPANSDMMPNHDSNVLELTSERPLHPPQHDYMYRMPPESPQDLSSRHPYDPRPPPSPRNPHDSRAPTPLMRQCSNPSSPRLPPHSAAPPHFGTGYDANRQETRTELLPPHMPQMPQTGLLGGLFPPSSSSVPPPPHPPPPPPRFHSFSPPLGGLGELHGHFSAADNERAEQEVARALETLSRTMRPYR